MESKYQVPNFLRREGESLVYKDDGEFIFYVPEIFFERKLAEVVGETILIMGILNYTINDKNGKNDGLKTFYFPTMFTTTPTTMEKIKGIKLTKTTPESDYRVLHYENGAKVVKSVMTEKQVPNADILVSMFLTGKLPNTIDYRYIYRYFIDNININGNDYGLSAQMFGILQAESCRSVDDLKTLFRHTQMTNTTNYQFIPIKQNAKFTSPFTSLTSENIDESIVAGSLIKDPKYSPLEKIII